MNEEKFRLNLFPIHYPAQESEGNGGAFAAPFVWIRSTLARPPYDLQFIPLLLHSFIHTINCWPTKEASGRPNGRPGQRANMCFHSARS